jgi:large conductance mechanosensitive channel
MGSGLEGLQPIPAAFDLARSSVECPLVLPCVVIGGSSERTTLPRQHFAMQHRETDHMSILREFRDFAVKGNVVDMAVGIIIGGAFGTIVQSLVKDVLMPPIGMMLGGVDFSNIKVPLRAAAAGQDPVTINIGVFLNNVISFLIVAAAVFALVKAINELKKRFEREAEKAPPPPPMSEVYLKEIRDALVKK